MRREVYAICLSYAECLVRRRQLFRRYHVKKIRAIASDPTISDEDKVSRAFWIRRHCAWLLTPLPIVDIHGNLSGFAWGWEVYPSPNDYSPSAKIMGAMLTTLRFVEVPDLEDNSD